MSTSSVDPVAARHDLVAERLRLGLVDPAEVVRDPHELGAVDARLLAEGVRHLVALVPRRDRDDRAAQLRVELNRVLRDVAEALHGGLRLRDVDAHLLQRLAQGEDGAVAGGLGAAERAAHADRLARDEAGAAVAVDRLALVEHPEHVLGSRHDVGSRHVDRGTDVLGDLAHPAAADAFLLARREVVRVADHAALGAAERDVDDGALPRHPHREGADRVDRLLRVEADAALARAARVVVLNAEAAEDLDLPVVHADRDREPVFAERATGAGRGSGASSARMSALLSNWVWAISKGLNEPVIWFSPVFLPVSAYPEGSAAVPEGDVADVGRIQKKCRESTANPAMRRVNQAPGRPNIRANRVPAGPGRNQEG